MRRWATLLAASCLAAPHGCKAQEPPRLATVVKPPLSEFKPEGKRYRRQYSRRLHIDLPPDVVAERKSRFDRLPRHFMGFVNPAERYCESYSIVDDWRLQEARWFGPWALKHWIPPGDIGRFKRKTKGGGGLNYILRTGIKQYSASCRYRGPRTDFYVSVKWHPGSIPFDMPGMMMGSLLENLRRYGTSPRRVTEAGFSIVRSSNRTGHIIRWPVSRGMYVRISTSGEYPREVIHEWLKRFPSSLPSDWTWKKHGPKWAESYAEFLMWKMSKMLPRDVEEATSFQAFAHQLTLNFAGLGPYRLPKDGAYTTAEKVSIWNEVVDWINSARGRLVWDKETKKFRIDTKRPRQPDRLKKLRLEDVTPDSKRPHPDPTLDYPEYQKDNERIKKSIEAALRGETYDGPIPGEKAEDAPRKN